MNATGIGLAGIEGAWWLPAARPFALPRQLAHDLMAFGRAIFALFDAVIDLYGTPAGDACGLNRLLEHKVPREIPRLMGAGCVLAVRPDFQLRLLGDPPAYELVATELEICPSTHGFAHAMQVGYGLDTDLVSAFARLLGGRELLFAGSSQWSEFLFEQLAFCRALAALGAHAQVLYDEPIAAIAEQIRRGAIWRPPMFGIRERPETWHDDIAERIRAHGFERFLWPNTGDWPGEVGDAVVFRFGYFDCFAADRLRRLLDWQTRGATCLNPTLFILDSKAIMASLQLPAVRRAIDGRDPGALAALDRCIPETVLVEPATAGRLRSEQQTWVVKYAGYDRGNQAWGGRSLRVGAQCSSREWADILDTCLELPWPVVAQRMIPTARVDIAYVGADGSQGWMRQGATRLRSFMLRDQITNSEGGRGVTVCGSHLTVSSGATHVSESTDAVQAPVVFRD